MCWRLPIVPGRFQPSIVGTGELNCRVRDGNGCTLTVINTNYYADIAVHYTKLLARLAAHIVQPTVANLVTRSGFEPLLPA